MTEQFGLDISVCSEVDKIVKMLVSNIGDNGNMKMTTIKTVLVDSMSGDFNDDMGDTVVDHMTEKFLDNRGIGRSGMKAKFSFLITDFSS